MARSVSKKGPNVGTTVTSMQFQGMIGPYLAAILMLTFKKLENCAQCSKVSILHNNPYIEHVSSSVLYTAL